MKSNPINSALTKEPVQHGDKAFPLQFYQNIKYYKSGLVFYNHWHEEAEILYVTEGELELVINDISIFAKKNSVILIPPNLLHVAYQSNSQKGSFSSIVFHPDFISSKNPDRIQQEQLIPFLDNTFVSSYVLDVTDRNNETIQQLLLAFEKKYYEAYPYRELILKGYIYQLLYLLLQREEKFNLKSASDYLNEDRKKKIIFYIETNYQKPLNLNELASILSLSKEQFCRFFKQAFRATPINYLNQYRINRSMELLTKSNLSIIDIALEVGFDSANYFSIVFRKFTGTTPSLYRKTT